MTTVSAIIAQCGLCQIQGTRLCSPRTYCQENSSRKPGKARIGHQVRAAHTPLAAGEKGMVSIAAPNDQAPAEIKAPPIAVRPAKVGMRNVWTAIAMVTSADAKSRTPGAFSTPPSITPVLTPKKLRDDSQSPRAAKVNFIRCLR